MNADKSQSKIFLKCILPQCQGLRFNVFHKFPRNPQRCKAWLEAFDSPILYAIPHLLLIQKSVCCRHFRVSDYVHPESRKLNAVAVPSLNLKELNELDKCRHSKVEKVYGFRDQCSDNEYSISNKRNYENDINKATNTNTIVEMEVVDESNLNSNVLLASKIMDYGELDILNDNIVSSSGGVNESSQDSTCVEKDENGFQIVVNDGLIQMTDSRLGSVIKADILWLRHICRCDQCFDSKKNRSLIKFFDLDSNLQPVMATVIEETRGLEIIWSDGHTSTYNLNHLYDKLQHKLPTPHSSNYLLWNYQHTQYRDDLQSINWYDLIQSSAGTYKALDRLQKSGVLIIKQIPANDNESLLKKSIITKLFNQSWHNFTTEKRQNFLETENKIPFSNCTFESMDKGLQILTVPNTKDYFKLKLVDCFQAIEQIPKDSYEFFTQFSMDYTFKDSKGFQYKNKIPLISKNSNMPRIWFNPFQLDDVKSQNFREVSKHFKIFNDVMNMQRNQWQVKLNAETIIILDNYRICWCLSEVKNNSELECIYMERKHYLSSLSVLEKNNMNT